MNDVQAKKAILEALRDGETVVSSASKGGVSHMTLYRWRDADPEFAQGLEEARDEGRAKRASELAAVLFQGASQAGTDPRFSSQLFFALTNLQPDEWRHVNAVRVSGRVDSTIISAQVGEILEELAGEARELLASREQPALPEAVEVEAEVLDGNGG